MASFLGIFSNYSRSLMDLKSWDCFITNPYYGVGFGPSVFQIYRKLGKENEKSESGREF